MCSKKRTLKLTQTGAPLKQRRLQSPAPTAGTRRQESPQQGAHEQEPHETDREAAGAQEEARYHTSALRFDSLTGSRSSCACSRIGTGASSLVERIGTPPLGLIPPALPKPHAHSLGILHGKCRQSFLAPLRSFFCLTSRGCIL